MHETVWYYKYIQYTYILIYVQIQACSVADSSSPLPLPLNSSYCNDIVTGESFEPPSFFCSSKSGKMRGKQSFWISHSRSASQNLTNLWLPTLWTKLNLSRESWNPLAIATEACVKKIFSEDIIQLTLTFGLHVYIYQFLVFWNIELPRISSLAICFSRRVLLASFTGIENWKRKFVFLKSKN